MVILGAGLAGLSLACALLEEGVSEPIVLIDRRTRWERDRTWCTWASETTSFAELAGHRWTAWRIAAHGHEAVARSSRHPYLHLDSRDVYEDALDRLARARNVELRSGEAVLEVRGDGESPSVSTTAGTIEASAIFDALGTASPLLRRQPPGEIELAQSFLGWEVELEAPAFDPGVATLMDFRADDHGGLRFIYVLPFSATRALIEDTSIGVRWPTPAERRRVLETELREHWGARDWRVVHEERGRVMMTNRTFALHHGSHIHAVGTAAGAVRPSSGYAFTRIQRHCSRLARAIAANEPLPTRLGPSRLARLDAIFLAALVAEPERFPEIFLRLGARVSGDVFARFMTDASTPADEALIIGALPKRPFVAAAVRSASSGTAAAALELARARR
jgi:lycopene beta-cyclase